MSGVTPGKSGDVASFSDVGDKLEPGIQFFLEFFLLLHALPYE